MREERECDVLRGEWGGRRLATFTCQRGTYDRLTTLTRERRERLSTRAPSVGVERLQLRFPRRTRIGW
jgi:hypothetical protein